MGRGEKLKQTSFLPVSNSDCEIYIYPQPERDTYSLSMLNDIIHIAFADDHLTVRKGVVSLLHSLGGIAVDIEAGNGIELLDLLKKADKEQKLPSIVILDINMPEMNGFDTIV